MAKNRAASKASRSIDVSRGDDKVFALLGTALPLLGYVVTVLAKKNSPYATFYGKQGVVLFVAILVAAVVSWVLELIPVIGGVLSGIVWVFFIILWVVGILNALSGEVRDLPLIGVYAGRL